MNLISIECIDVNTLVAPCTTHSLVSGIATGVQVARKTGSFLLHSGRNDKYRPCTSTTCDNKHKHWRFTILMKTVR